MSNMGNDNNKLGHKNATLILHFNKKPTGYSKTVGGSVERGDSLPLIFNVFYAADRWSRLSIFEAPFPLRLARCNVFHQNGILFISFEIAFLFDF